MACFLSKQQIKNWDENVKAELPSATHTSAVSQEKTSYQLDFEYASFYLQQNR